MKLKFAWALAFLMMATGPAAAQGLNGDADAVEAVDRMIERLGGKEIWAGTKTLYVEYYGWRTEPNEPVVERAWRDLQEPYQHVVFEGRSFETKFSMTPRASWLNRVSGDRRFTEDEHAANLAFWDFDFYTIIRNLAVEDARITVKSSEDGRILLTGPDGADWGWFEIDGTGQPVRWGAPDGENALEYIYGPVKSFGNVNFPAWGTARNGFWRFEYVDIDVSRDPIPMTLKPPRR